MVKTTNMKWHEVDGFWVSQPYRIYRDTMGFSLWVYGKQSGIIGRGIGSLKLAQDMAAKHAERQRGSSI